MDQYVWTSMDGPVWMDQYGLVWMDKYGWTSIDGPVWMDLYGRTRMNASQRMHHKDGLLNQQEPSERKEGVESVQDIE